MRKGVHPTYPVQFCDVEKTEKSMAVYTHFQRVSGRTNLEDGPQVTVHFSSPMPDVIRVRLTHFEGQIEKGPFFELNETPDAPVSMQEDEQSVSLCAGRLQARVSKTGDWRVDFLGDGKVITSSMAKAMAILQTDEGGHYMRDQLNLGVGECVYGLGERFTPFVKNGQAVDMWHEDGGTCSEIAYKNIPFYVTNRGYGVFVNHPEEVSFEVASEMVERVSFSVPGQTLEYFVIYGPTLKEVIQKYTALTGRPALPPAWSFGLWLSTSYKPRYDEETVSQIVKGMEDRDLPVHVFHYDALWMHEFKLVNLHWDERWFPDPKGMLQRLRERGLHFCVWINSYVAQRSELFREGVENGYFVKRPDGSVWQWDRWQAGMALVDFTNPAACRWFGGKLRALLEMGVDSIKTDFGERIPTEDVVYFDGSDPVKMHNYYTYLYNKTVFGVLEEFYGKGNAIVFARSATSGGQKFPVHWGGDSTATFESMAETLRGGLSLGFAGFGFWSHDIGGFENLVATADVYKRWCAFGLLSSHSRLHGSDQYKVPWLFDEEAVDVLRFFTKLKCRLMPYLFAAACEAHEKGIPMLRAMPMEFPEDPACDALDRQYMLGENLLVAPVFSSSGQVDYYLPAGRWIDFLSGRAVEGGRWVREQHSFMSLPLMARPNSIVPVGKVDHRPDYDYADGVTFHVFEPQDGAALTSTLHNLQGEAGMTLGVQRSGQKLTIRTVGAEKPWSVLLRGAASVTSVSGGTSAVGEQGVNLTPAAGSNEMVVEL
jgi:alpha-D-xyloside xylohydrolase